MILIDSRLYCLLSDWAIAVWVCWLRVTLKIIKKTKWSLKIWREGHCDPLDIYTVGHIAFFSLLCVSVCVHAASLLDHCHQWLLFWVIPWYNLYSSLVVMVVCGCSWLHSTGLKQTGISSGASCLTSTSVGMVKVLGKTCTRFVIVLFFVTYFDLCK